VGEAHVTSWLFRSRISAVALRDPREVEYPRTRVSDETMEAVRRMQGPVEDAGAGLRDATDGGREVLVRAT